MTTLYDPATGRAVAIYRTDGTLVWGGGETQPTTPATPPTPPTGPMLNVATRMSAANNGAVPAGGTGGTMTATRHVLTVDVTTVTLHWVTTFGYGHDTGATFQAAISRDGGPIIPVTVGGAGTWHLDKSANGAVLATASDAVELNAYAGDVVNVYVWAAADGSGSITSDLTRQTAEDRTAKGSFSTALNSLNSPTVGGWGYRPARIVAPSNRTSWLGVGDSIIQQPWSYLERALDARGLAGVKSAQGGDGWVYYPGRWAERYAPHIATAPHVIDQMGVNDATIANGLRLWNHAKANGAKYILKTTISPTTLEGAALDRPTVQQLNAWLRDGAPVSADKATALETGTTDPTAVRCAVVRPDGTIKAAQGAGHPINAVTDVAARIESSPGYLSAEAAAVIGGDRLHPSAAVHAMLADRLARDLEILGF